jgi:trehalose 6-phosphate phosphatase
VTIAIISGRDTDFLAAQLPVSGLILIGNHGLEERLDGVSTLTPEAAGYAETVERAARAASLVTAKNPGVVLERKRGTVAVHYRQAPEPAALAARLEPALRRIAASTKLELRSGRLVFELRPPIPIDKGAVLLRLVDRLHADRVLVAGDDWTDLDAFRVLGQIRSERIRALAIAVRSTEAPDDLQAEADLVVDGVEGMMQGLRMLLEVVNS